LEDAMLVSIRPLLIALVSLALVPLTAQESRPDERAKRAVVWYMRYEAREDMGAEARFRCTRTVQYLETNFPGTQGDCYTTYHETRPWVIHRFVETPDLQSMYAIWDAETEEGYLPMNKGLKEATVADTALDLLLLPTEPRQEEGPQYRMLRTVRAKFSRMPQALRIAEGISTYLNQSYERLHVRTFIQDGGEVFTLGWTIDFASEDDWHDALLRMLRDPAYEALLKQADDVFLGESARDVLMESRAG
jgi:hypothetical protein